MKKSSNIALQLDTSLKMSKCYNSLKIARINAQNKQIKNKQNKTIKNFAPTLQSLKMIEIFSNIIINKSKT